MYGSVLQLREYLDQVPQGNAHDVRLFRILTRASSIIDLSLDDIYGASSASTRVVYGSGTAYLSLPDNASAVTSVTTLAGYTVPYYVHEGKMLIVTDSAGVRPALFGTAWYGYRNYGSVWSAGVPYTVSATFGGRTPTATEQESITGATLELAAAIEKERTAGFATVIGVEGAGAVNIHNALPLKAKVIIDTIAARYKVSSSVGVY